MFLLSLFSYTLILFLVALCIANMWFLLFGDRGCPLTVNRYFVWLHLSHPVVYFSQAVVQGCCSFYYISWIISSLCV
jgi:hypothetical protein